MSAASWQLAFPTRNWVTTYRGVPVVIQAQRDGQADGDRMVHRREGG
jgi:hypothetical protein